MKTKIFFKRILNYLLQGLIILAPIGVTIYILYVVLAFLDDLIPVKIPGLGILIILVMLIITGFLASTIIAKPIVASINRYIRKMPLLNTLISSVKDLLGAFIGKKKKFTEPVLVMVNKQAGIEQIGFVTCNELSQIGIPGKKIVVYIPFSFSFMGYIFVVPSENVTKIDVSPAEAFKFIISGGVIEVADENKKES